MPLAYEPLIPADALVAAVPEAFAWLHFLRLGLAELLGETPVSNGLSELSEFLPIPFCAELSGLFEPFTIDPFGNELAVLAVVATATACVTVTVY